MSKSNNSDTDEYDVGYKKPPKATQFTKGQSGNPKGRPKGKRNWATELHSALEQKVSITDNGGKRKVTKLQAATMQLANKAAAGDSHAIRLLLQLVPGMEAALNHTDKTSLSNEQDLKVLAEMLQRMDAPEVEIITADNPDEKKGSDDA